MTTNPMARLFGGGWRPRPWPVLFVGLGITAAGLLLTTAGDAYGGLRFVLFLIGLVTAGTAVSIRLRTAGQAFEERLESAGILAVAAFAALLAYFGTDPAWDSLQMALIVTIAAAMIGVVLILLPTPWRMVAASVLILAHFGGMVTAATTIDPPGASAPWLSQMAWVYVYRPYLQFMYLNNAYHFYSPEPGPPSLVWFHIKYKDGSVKWVKIPHRDDDPVPIHHTRLLSVTESTATVSTQPPADPRVWQDLQDRRVHAGDAYGLPMAPENIMAMQYQEPQEYSVKMLQSCVRHIANVYAGPPGNPIAGIKVYRLRHSMMMPGPMALGRNPLDQTTFVGFYQGEYDKDANLLHVQDVRDANDTLIDAKDPFRYWYMPVYYKPKKAGQMFRPDMKLEELELVDELSRHAQLDLSKKPSEQPKELDPNDTPWEGPEKPQP